MTRSTRRHASPSRAAGSAIAHRRGARRSSLPWFLALVLACAGIVAAPTASSSAADLRNFDPGFIISDAVFYNPGTMSADAIQSFLESRGSRCTVGTDGTACLKNYRATTYTRGPDSRCTSAYQGAADERAADIIAKVANACGINPQVLIVTLQKEQGLVTASSSSVSAGRYRSAMGYGCPDGAPCDERYYGFFNQVYMAAWQFRSYALDPSRFTFKPRQNASIRYNPSASCGSSTVYIQNQATASLYNYTPYQPNAAALAAGYGTGDSCSSYGNRNFWNYFVDWFGSISQYPTVGWIADAYTRNGGPAGVLGYPIGDQTCGLVNGGCYQSFRNGSIHYSATTPAYATTNPIRGAWAYLGWEQSPLGYPTSDVQCGLARGGCYQNFQGGSVHYSSATNAYATLNPVRAAWAYLGWESSALGYPISNVTCGQTRGGCYQDFEGGSIHYSSRTGAYAVTNPARAAWAYLGWQDSFLGYPTSNVTCGLARGGCYQNFEGGSIHYSAATNAYATGGRIESTWQALGWESSSFGYPTGVESCAGGRCTQTFEGGAMSYGSSGAVVTVTGTVFSTWRASGGLTGPLGHPTGALTCGLTNGGCYQAFQGGTIHYSATTSAYAVTGAVKDTWAGLDWERSVLGYPTGTLTCGLINNGCYQNFQGGSIHYSATTRAYATSGSVEATWAALDWERSALGYPTGALTCGLTNGGCYQAFQGGTIHYSATTSAYAVTGAVKDTWAGLDWERSALGYPTSNLTCTSGTTDCSQTFQGGTITSTSAGTRVRYGS